jgi:diacylglycerol kinase family enzyme
MKIKNMKTYLFINPASGRHSTRRLDFVLDRLNAIGNTPEVFRVRTPVDVLSCCATINRESGPRLVIVAAGDGTFNAVVNGLLPGTATLAVLPFGTSNVLAAEIGICSTEDGISRIAAGKTRSLSVGVIELTSATHRFVLMAGIGLDGAVVRDVRPTWKRFLRQGAYAISALGRVLAWDKTTFEIVTSDARSTCHTAIICNASRYGGNFVLAPECSPFSAGLMAICIRGNQRRSYLRSAYNLFRGNTVASNHELIRLSAADTTIEGTKPIQIDGDFIGYGPARISEINDFARMIV